MLFGKTERKQEEKYLIKCIFTKITSYEIINYDRIILPIFTLLKIFYKLFLSKLKELKK